MNKWIVATSLLIAVSVPSQLFADEQAVLDRYSKTCSLCHSSGAAGAPMTGNAEQWAPRLEKGLDTLVASAKNGINAMPPKGMCFDCSDDEFKALIKYMSKGQ